MDDLIRWLRAQLDADEITLTRHRNGHEGPCLNYEGQSPENYAAYDSCCLHIEAAKATPYRNAEFGLDEIEAKRRIIDEFKAATAFSSLPDTPSGGYASALAGVVRILALPYADRPAFRAEWRP